MPTVEYEAYEIINDDVVKKTFKVEVDEEHYKRGKLNCQLCDAKLPYPDCKMACPLWKDEFPI